MVRCRKRMQKFQFNGKICFRRSVVLPLLIMCFVTPMLMIHLSPSLPRNFSLGPAPEPTCELPGKPFALDDFEFCVGACRSQCFPRVKDLCISSSEVNYCAKAKEEEEIASAQLMHTNTDEKKLIKFKYSRMPEIMRFQGERLTLPVINSSCDQEKKGIRGLSLVADQRFLPYKKPNPHHEAEKLIPAILFTRNQKDSNHTFYWFSAPDEVSEWGKGLLEAFNMHKRVKYIDFPKKKNSTICFEDAIVYSAGTNLYYVPDHDTNDWLRQRVLRFCNVPIVG